MSIVVFSAGGGEYRRFGYLSWVPGDFEWHGEDGRAFVFWVVTGEVCGDESIHPVVAELFGGEVFRAPFVDMVDCAAYEMFVSVYFHGV